MKWISVEERLPPNLKEVLYVAVNDTGTKEIMTGHREMDEYWTHCCLFYSTMRLNELVKVTHWMELPGYPHTEPCQHLKMKRVHLDELGLMDICEACSRAIPPNNFNNNPVEAA
jgi:hypothetical protein